MNYYEHHLGDYMRDAGHLSMLEDGAYRRLLDAYYIREEPLPVSIKDVCRIVRAVSKPERVAVETVLREFFDLRETGWHHIRCDKEIERYNAKREKAKRSANARWKQPETQCKDDAKAMRTHCEGNALQSPVTRHQLNNTDAGARARDDLDGMEGALLDAAGSSLDPTSTGLMVLSLPIAWVADGCDLVLDILPAIRAASARASPGSVRSWKYFSQAVADARAKRLAPMPEGRTNEPAYSTTPQSRDNRAREAHMLGISEALAERGR